MPRLMYWLKQKGLNLKGAIITHFHVDKSAGIDYLNKHDIATYSFKQTNVLLRKDKKALAKYTFTSDNFEF